MKIPTKRISFAAFGLIIFLAAGCSGGSGSGAGGSGAVVPRDDHSDSPSGATTITVNGASISGSIEVGGDVDYFSFATTSGQRYTISTGGAMDTYLQLYDTNGTTLLAEDDDSGSGTLSLISWTAPSSSRFYVRVSHFRSSGTGSYTLSITTTNPQLSVTRMYVGSRTFEGNTGIATIDSNELLNLGADFSLPDSQTSFTWRILNGTCPSEGCFTGGSSPHPHGIVYQAPQVLSTTTFTLEVQVFSGTDFANGFVSVTVLADSTGGDDHSDSPSGATIVGSDGTITSGNIETAGDNDYFQFLATSGQTYRIETGGNIDTVLHLYDTNGTTQLAEDDDSGPGLLSLITWTAPSTNNYFVRVRHFSSGTGSYTLSVTNTTPSGGNQPQLIIGNGFDPHLSPDGQTIVFLRIHNDVGADGQTDIYSVNLDGSNFRRLTNTPESEISPQWSPDGSYVVFLRSEEGYRLHGDGGIWTVDPITLATTQFLLLGSQNENFCLWVRGGTTEIYLIRNDSTHWLSLSSSDWRLDFLGLAQRRNDLANPVAPRSAYLATGPTATQSMFCDNAPDIVLDSNGIPATLIMWNPCSQEDFVVTNTQSFPWPCLSPDGTRILVGSDGGVPIGLYVFDADGQNLQQLTTDIDHDATWSGNTVVFVRIENSNSDLLGGNIYWMDAPQ